MRTGNRVTAYKYNKNDELLRTDTLNTDTEEDSVVIYKYDENGNQLATVNRYEIPSDRKGKTYIDLDVTLGDNRLNENAVSHYNAENQLIRTLTKNYKVSFAYDAEGLRTSKTVNGEKTVFVWDGDQLVMELSDSGKVQKRYVRGNDLVYFDKGENTEKQYYVTDPHGNVVQLTDESGAITKTYEYDSFGNEVKPDSKDGNPFRYCGEYYDRETEEVYLRARYYQPAVGRFLTRDTYTGEEDDPGSLHLYTYCGNDGVNAWDPSGHWGKNVVHNYMTQIIAVGIGYSKSDASIFGEACGAADDTYKGKKNVWKTKIKGIKVTNKDFPKLTVFSSDAPTTKGQQKIELHRPTKKQFSNLFKKGQIRKNISKIKTKKKKKIITALWLHMIQDRYAHGYLGCKHTKWSDDVMYKRVVKKGRKIQYKSVSFDKEKSDLVKNNPRLKSTVKDTIKYLKLAKSVLGLADTGIKTKQGELYRKISDYLLEKNHKKAMKKLISDFSVNQ